jgi:hypothetical protein
MFAWPLPHDGGHAADHAQLVERLSQGARIVQGGRKLTTVSITSF